jgi:uncharacterized protein (TIGR00255 family)
VTVRSMTGFGAAEDRRGAATARVELRTVNHRHLQLKVRLPGELASLEPKLEALLRKRLGRGAVTAHVALERDEESEAAGLNADRIRSLVAELRALGSELGLSGELSLDSVLQMPGLLAGKTETETDPDQGAWVLGVAGKAVDELLSMREYEGQAMLADLQLNAGVVATELRAIQARMPVVVQEHHQKLTQRVNDLVADSAGVSSADLAREIAVLAERLDVSEETSRLEAHLGQLESLLASGGPVGRKLDFLVQEFLREANTIGSKCSDAEVAHHVVELKTHIERLREQVQNIE